jgi:hypothetical protein
MPNQFFCEGNDIKFIKDILKSLNKSNENDIYVKTNGWTNLHLVTSKFLENTNKGGTNFIFFDADNDFDKRKVELQKIGLGLGITFELFLFPNNNDVGNFETLLCNIISPKYMPIFTCFENYCLCISSSDTSYLIPDLKSKFFAFLESSGQKTNIEQINFLNTDFYELNHISLTSLRLFISTYM